MKVPAALPVATVVSRNTAAPQAVPRIERLEGAGLQGELESSAARSSFSGWLTNQARKTTARPSRSSVAAGRASSLCMPWSDAQEKQTPRSSSPTQQNGGMLPLRSRTAKGKRLESHRRPCAASRKPVHFSPVLPHPLHGGLHERRPMPRERQFQVALADVYRPGAGASRTEKR